VNQMKSEDYGNREPELDRLFGRYREACGSPEASPNFMPMVWRAIEARQSKSMIFERVAKSMAAAAAALSFALGLFLVVSAQQPSAFFSGSYVEEIASEHGGEFGTFSAPVRLELMNTENRVQ
jgi:hypothetical protein